MRKFLMGAAAAAVMAAAAVAQDSVQSRLENALGFEWFLANCEQAQSANAMVAMNAAMTINGHTISDVEAAREKVQAGIQAAYPVQEDACADYADRLAPPRQ